MSIQNAINSMLSSVERGVALYTYSPEAESKRREREIDNQLEREAGRAIEAGKRQKEAGKELEKDPENEDWKAIGEAAQQERYAAQNRQVELLRDRYLRTGDREYLEEYLNAKQEQALYKDPESIESAIMRGRGAADARRIEEEYGFTPEEWEVLAMENEMEEDFGNEQSQISDERVAKQILTGRSQKANFEAHKEALRRKQYKHTRYQGRKTGGDR